MTGAALVSPSRSPAGRSRASAILGSTLFLMMTMVGACSGPMERPDGSPAPAQSGPERPADRIDHLLPRRDSVGPLPTTFEWTPVEGADSYRIGVWSEVDVRVWTQTVRTTSAVWPEGVVVEPGTFFWSVTAVRGDRPIADSGRSAFVVTP